jgi:hypothetical protein
MILLMIVLTMDIYEAHFVLFFTVIILNVFGIISLTELLSSFGNDAMITVTTIS